MAVILQAKQKTKLYEKTVIEFAAKEGGYFFLLSHDNTFIKVFRNTLNKELVIASDRLRVMGDEDDLLKEFKTPIYRDKKILLLVERVLDGRSTLHMIRQIRGLFDSVQIIVLTAEVEKNILVLLHEIGVDNFITKPISVETLIEKIAFTVRPQGKIGQYIDKAKDYLARRKYDEALAMADRILEIKPGSAAALMIRGDALREQGKAAEAETAYNEAADSSPMYLEPLKRLAGLYKEEGRLEEQLDYLERLDKLSPLNVDRKIDMGEIHVRFGNSERAGELFDQAVKNATREAASLIEEVRSSIAERCMDKEPALAEQHYRAILESKAGGLKRSDLGIFNRLGIALRRQKRWEDAVAEYEKALKVAPDDENLLFNKAVALSEGGKHVEAVRDLEKALAINPRFHARSSVLSFNVAVMYINAKQHSKARPFLENALKVDPGHKGAKRLLKGL